MTGICNLVLSGNRFYGSLPQELLPSFYHLMLNGNKITRKIPEEICLSQDFTVLDFSNNGVIGFFLFAYMTNLAVLNLSRNSLVGSIPSELCQLKNLMFLDMSRNNLSGPIHCLPNLQYLHLSENQFNGTFPFPFSLGTDTYTIDLRGNQFSGILPNMMLEAFPQLKILLLKQNSFEGMIPNDICKLKHLCLLDLSHNKLSGQLPSCLSSMGLDGDFHHFQYADNNSSSEYKIIPSGSDELENLLAKYSNFIWQPDQEEFMTKSRQEYYKGDILNYMFGPDFSSNQLKGSIPEGIGDMKWLRALNFSKNHLDGSIPNSFNLTDLESLYLSCNNLTGQIPPELVALQYLEVFSVAYNNLSGPTPGTTGQFITFDQNSYEGNAFLCGPPLLKSCSTPPSTPPSEEHGEEDDDQAGDIILFGCSAMFYLVGFWTSLGLLYFKKKLAMVMVFWRGQVW